MKGNGKCIIFSAPSGAGKTTIVRSLLTKYPNFAFSVSACSRSPRSYEENGVHYYFFSVEEFKNKIKQDAFIEWEEVYKDHFYGTLKSEIEKLWGEDKIVIFDVDAYGGISLKEFFGQSAMSIFILPPSMEELKNRLVLRNTETPETLKTRLSKAKEEIALQEHFDKAYVNDVLEDTIATIQKDIDAFLKA